MSLLKTLFGKKGKGDKTEAFLKEPKYIQNADSAKASKILGLLREQLGGINVMQLLYYMSEIMKLGEPAVGPLCQTLLSDDNCWMRAYAAKGLRDIGSKTAVPALLSALSDKDARVRPPVAGALGALADSRAKQHLVKLLKDESESVRDAAQTALDEIRSANPA